MEAVLRQCCTVYVSAQIAEHGAVSRRGKLITWGPGASASPAPSGGPGCILPYHSILQFVSDDKHPQAPLEVEETSFLK